MMPHNAQLSYPIASLFAESDFLSDAQLTQAQLKTAVQEAQKFHEIFKAECIVEEGKGFINPVQKDWAKSLLRKNTVSQAVIEKINSWSFMKRRPEDQTSFISYVEACFAAQQPLLFRIPFGPLKNIRCSGSNQSPDLAEYLTFIQLSRVMSAVASLYPHGIKVHIVPDDMRARQANRCPQCYVHCYISGLQKMVQLLSFEKWMHVEYGQSALYQTYKVDSYQQAAIEKLQEWKTTNPEAFAMRWDNALENAKKNFNIELCEDTTEEVEAAAWRYLVAHQSEILSGMWSPPDVFPLVYANHPNNYQLYSLGQKKTKLPWQIALPKTLLPEADRPLVF
jgi:Pyoverdine/dityrosine biosynthesis protein